MNHFLATYIDFIQTIGSLTLFIFVVFLIRQILYKRKNTVIEAQIHLEDN
tara:strand:- start:235 stop:384 length:150 start_codon:yes stop_codon:yes gene_type:complete